MKKITYLFISLLIIAGCSKKTEPIPDYKITSFFLKNAGSFNWSTDSTILAIEPSDKYQLSITTNTAIDATKCYFNINNNPTILEQESIQIDSSVNKLYVYIGDGTRIYDRKVLFIDTSNARRIDSLKVTGAINRKGNIILNNTARGLLHIEIYSRWGELLQKGVFKKKDDLLEVPLPTVDTSNREGTYVSQFRLGRNQKIHLLYKVD